MLITLDGAARVSARNCAHEKCMEIFTFCRLSGNCDATLAMQRSSTCRASTKRTKRAMLRIRHGGATVCHCQ